MSFAHRTMTPSVLVSPAFCYSGNDNRDHGNPNIPIVFEDVAHDAPFLGLIEIVPGTMVDGNFGASTDSSRGANPIASGGFAPCPGPLFVRRDVVSPVRSAPFDARSSSTISREGFLPSNAHRYGGATTGAGVGSRAEGEEEEEEDARNSGSTEPRNAADEDADYEALSLSPLPFLREPYPREDGSVSFDDADVLEACHGETDEGGGGGGGEIDSFRFNANSNGVGKIFISFYSPSQMTNVAFVPYKKVVGIFTLFALIFAFLTNCFVWIAKRFMKLSNDLTVRMTKDEAFPDASFSHVEISTSTQTYYVKWGGKFQRVDGRQVSSDHYGVLCLVMNRSDYDIVVDQCENACRDDLGFNYIGSVVNFVLPERVRYFLWENGVYYDPKTRFCSEFISETLGKTQEYSEYFGSGEGKILPQMTSPVALFSVLSNHMRTHPLSVCVSSQGVKRSKNKRTKKVSLGNGGGAVHKGRR